jgi:hypothetical protein
MQAGVRNCVTFGIGHNGPVESKKVFVRAFLIKLLIFWPKVGLIFSTGFVILSNN